MQVDAVNHLPLGTPCLQPEGLETSSPYLSLEIGDNIANILSRLVCAQFLTVQMSTT
jgi:hypothetical protein